MTELLIDTNTMCEEDQWIIQKDQREYSVYSKEKNIKIYLLARNPHALKKYLNKRSKT